VVFQRIGKRLEPLIETSDWRVNAEQFGNADPFEYLQGVTRHVAWLTRKAASRKEAQFKWTILLHQIERKVTSQVVAAHNGRVKDDHIMLIHHTLP
jgi:hypothetical protein